MPDPSTLDPALRIILDQLAAMGGPAVSELTPDEEAELRRLRRILSGIRLVQVIHVTGPESVDEARDAAPLVDAILLDSGNPRLAVKELGGTGRVHDWTTSRRIRDSVGVPVLLAGGLHPGNAREATCGRPTTIAIHDNTNMLWDREGQRSV